MRVSHAESIFISPLSSNLLSSRVSSSVGRQRFALYLLNNLWLFFFWVADKAFGVRSSQQDGLAADHTARSILTLPPTPRSVALCFLYLVLFCSTC